MKKIRKIFLLSIISLTIFSCSNLSKNTIDEGVLPIRNGVFSDKTWKEDLVLKRYSWYHELTLQFELLIGTVSPQSGFNFWFSKEELLEMNKCQDSRIVLAYSLDTKNIPYFQIYNQLEQNGFSKFDLIEFKRNLIQHPDSNMNSIKLYHVFGVCRKNGILAPVKISFPGFSEKTLN